MNDNEQCFDELMADSIKYGVFDDIDNTIEMLIKLKKKLNSFDCDNSILIYNEFQAEIWIIQDIINKINKTLGLVCEKHHIEEDNKPKSNENKKKPNKSKHKSNKKVVTKNE